MKSMIATLAAIASLAVTAQNAMDLATQLNWAKPQDGKRIVIELQNLGQEGVNQLVQTSRSKRTEQRGGDLPGP